MTITGIRLPLLAALAALSAATSPGLAQDRLDALPGVDGKLGVAGPAPEPETVGVAEASPYGEGFVRIPGTDTYVRISGLVRYDIEFVGKNRK
jgi:hypothetical protein